MSNIRQYVQIGDTPPPGISATTLAFAQVASLAAWPAVAKWAVNTDKTGFKDVLQRGIVRMANGKTVIDGRFFDTGDGTATGYSVQDVLTGIVVPAFDTSGDFTIGMRFNPSALTVSGGTWGGVACGSYSSANNAWRLENDTNGNFRVGAPGGLQSAYTDYVGPLLTASTIAYAVLRFTRSTGTLQLRVNGVNAVSFQNDALKTATFAAEVAFGLYWDFSTAAVKYRATQLLKAFAANAALIDTDLAAAEAYLAATVSA